MNQIISPIPAFGPALPEIVLAVAALGLVLLGAFKGDGAKKLIDGIAIVALVIAGFYPDRRHRAAFRPSTMRSWSDGFARAMKMLTLIGSIAAILLSVALPRAKKSWRASNIRSSSCSRPSA